MRRQRILFIGEAITLSHIARPSLLANTLDPERYEVVFACEARLRPLLAIDPAWTFVPLASRMYGADIEEMVNFREEFFSLATLEAYIVEDLALLNRFCPDAVVGDMRLSLNTSARLAGVPYVGIQNCYWHPKAQIGLRIPFNPFAPMISPDTLGKIANFFAPSSTLYHNILALKYGAPPPGPDFRSVLSNGDHTVFPDIPEWSPLKATPPNATYVGPLTWAPAVKRPAWWDALDTARPTVYVSLGSSGQPRLVQTIADIAVELGCQVIVATAGRTQIAPVEGHVFVADYLNGSEAAARSVLAICNGGSTSGPQALAEGCPVLGVTSNMDQGAFMALLARTGAGLEVGESSANRDTLRRGMTAVLNDPAYRAAAGRLKAAMTAIDTKSAFEHALRLCIASGAMGGARRISA